MTLCDSVLVCVQPENKTMSWKQQIKYKFMCNLSHYGVIWSHINNCVSYNQSTWIWAQPLKSSRAHPHLWTCCSGPTCVTKCQESNEQQQIQKGLHPQPGVCDICRKCVIASSFFNMLVHVVLRLFSSQLHLNANIKTFTLSECFKPQNQNVDETCSCCTCHPPSAHCLVLVFDFLFERIYVMDCFCSGNEVGWP